MKVRSISDQLVIEATQSSDSVYGVLRYLRLSISGNSHRVMKERISRLNLDTSHFVSGARKSAQNTKICADDILVDDRLDGYKEKAYRLRKALFEKGVEEICADCGIGTEWNGRPIQLEIHHVNGRNCDNRLENLQFLCPNCHSQK